MSSHPSAIKRDYSPYPRGLFISKTLRCALTILLPVLTGVTPTLKSISINGKNFPRVAGVILEIVLKVIAIIDFPRTYGGYSAELHLCSATIVFLAYGGYSHIGLLIIDEIQLSSYIRGLFHTKSTRRLDAFFPVNGGYSLAFEQADKEATLSP